MVKLPVVENDPPHSISMVSGSVMSGLTWRRLRSEMAGERLAAPPLDWAKRMAGVARSSTGRRIMAARIRLEVRLSEEVCVAGNAPSRSRLGLDHGAGALDLIDRHRAFD